MHVVVDYVHTGIVTARADIVGFGALQRIAAVCVLGEGQRILAGRHHVTVHDEIDGQMENIWTGEIEVPLSFVGPMVTDIQLTIPRRT